MKVTTLIAFIAGLCFFIVMLAGTAYLVQWHNWSPWWFVPAILICGGVSVKEFR